MVDGLKTMSLRIVVNIRVSNAKRVEKRGMHTGMTFDTVSKKILNNLRQLLVYCGKDSVSGKQRKELV